MSVIDDYQEFMWAWHNKKYPDATVFRVLAKGIEEYGEVAEAIIKQEPVDRVVEEVGDMLNVLATILSMHGRTLTEAIDYAITVPAKKGP
jgi:NTP pyrophosphatase (non-canonical NTP hydrolase)